ncbi:MAG: tetratricopeptide repeat protein [Planctomycetaceae bacterium]
MASVAQTLQTAISHHRAGELDKAESLYRDIVRIDPRHADALHLLGLAAHQRKKSETAVDLIARAIAVNDNFAPYHSNLGVAHRALGEYPEAIASFQKAAELDEGYADPHFNLGTLLLEEGSFEDAISHFRRGLRINAGYAPAWFGLGKTHELRGDLTAAIECYRTAIEKQPSYVEAQCALAVALHREQRLDQAIDAFRDALKVNPQLARREESPIRMLTRLVNLSDAANSYEESLNLHRETQRVLSHMVHAIEDVELITDPFEHFYLDQVFPADFYPRLLESLPENRFYEELPHKDAILPNGHSARLQLKLEEANIQKLPEPLRSFWMNFATVLSSERLKFAIFGKFGRAIHANPQVVLLRDIAGYQILPHPDIPQKKVTTQFYLPKDDSKTHLGTWLYTRENDEFRNAKQFRFARNSGYSFLVSKTSWHGVEKTQLTDGPRDSLMIIYYRV